MPSADGNYEVTLMTKALVHHTGEVVWKPPAMYKSTCEIDVEWFVSERDFYHKHPTKRTVFTAVRRAKLSDEVRLVDVRG